MVHWLSSSIFSWSFVVLPASATFDKTPLFYIYRHKNLVLTQFHLIPSSTKLHWPSTTKYQPVLPHTDQVPPNTNQHRLLLTHYYHVSTSSPSYWRSIIIYQPPLYYTDQVPTSAAKCQKRNVRLSFVDLRWVQLYDSLVFDIFHKLRTYFCGI